MLYNYEIIKTSISKELFRFNINQNEYYLFIYLNHGIWKTFHFT